jgi:enoyl-CoA hydratase/carnithine racemase
MQSINVSRADGIVTVTLDRPAKKNAVSKSMWAELLAAFHEIASRADDRVVVVTGAGSDFSAGGDMVDARDDAPPERQLPTMRVAGATAIALHRLPQPTIAKVRGVAFGAGCNLALGCDLVLAGASARFSEVFIQRGLSLDCGGSWLLPRRLGMHRAKELAFFGEILSAEDAFDLGLLNRVVPDGELDDVVDGYVQRLLQAAPIALAQTKRLLNNAMNVTLQQAVDDEAAAQTLNFSTTRTAALVGNFAQQRAAAVSQH